MFNSNAKFEKEKIQNILNAISIVFAISPLNYRKMFTDDYYPFGYFPRTGTMGCGLLKQTTTTMATRTSLNERFNEQNNSCARAL